jgi:hypothetical protein
MAIRATLAWKKDTREESQRIMEVQDERGCPMNGFEIRFETR